jgi:hypothetical protein
MCTLIQNNSRRLHLSQSEKLYVSLMILGGFNIDKRELFSLILCLQRGRVVINADTLFS